MGWLDDVRCMKVIGDIIVRHGVPETFYMDQGACFGRIGWHQDATQVGRALKEVGCHLLLATSPQAKGRVERLWGTLQDRLIAELKYHQINRIPTANEFLSRFIDDFNHRFAISPREQRSAFKPYVMYESINDIFCVKEARKISNGNIFSWENEKYIINVKDNLAHKTLYARLHQNYSTSFEVMGKKVPVIKVEKDVKTTRLKYCA